MTLQCKPKKSASCVCAHCGDDFKAMAGHVNRSNAKGARLFCGKACAGLARRKNILEADKKARKSAYDARRRIELADELRIRKAEYYQRTKDPIKEAIARKKRMHKHVAYCQRPEYKEWKRDYDRRHRAQKSYGEFAECFLLTQDIRKECLNQQTDYEIRLAAGTLSKSQKRKRDYERFNRNQPETGSMGNAG